MVKIHKMEWKLEGSFYTSPNLSANSNLVHGFSTLSAGDFKEPSTVDSFLKEQGFKELFLLSQVHSTRVVTISAKNKGTEADGWVGKIPTGSAIGILTADCLPILLHDSKSGISMALHAGWRSALGGIVKEGMKAFRSLGGSPDSTVVALGPAIGPDAFEVGEEVATLLPKNSPFIKPRGGGKFLLDLPGYLKDALLEEGLPGESISLSNLCTYTLEKRFFSHRRDDDPRRICTFMGRVR